MRAVSYTRTTSCYPGEIEYPSDVIAIQNRHIGDYAKTNHMKLVDKYSDRKKDIHENTAFEKLLLDGMQRKFDIVIVDSIFRAGKDLWNAKEVLLQTFHYAGISFAVVEDDFDSTGKSNNEAEAYFAEKYKIYRKEHIRYQVKERNRKGILNWKDLVYGYQMNEDNTGIVVDQETAPVVERIFTMFAAGVSVAVIAETLRMEKVLTPKAVKGTKAKIADPYRWSALTVTRLLTKTVYAGYWTKTVHGITHEHTNEPIISKTLFEQVQKIVEKNHSSASPRRTIRHNRYAGLVCDSKDGFCLHLKRLKSGLEYFVYGKDQRKRGGDKHVLVSDVDYAVREEMRRQKELAVRILSKIRCEGQDRAEALIGGLKKEYFIHAMMIAKQEKARMAGNSDMTKTDITEVDTALESGESNLIEIYEDIFREYPEKAKRIQVAYSEENPWLKLMLTWDESTELEKEVLQKYIYRIVLDQLTTITVETKESVWLLELPAEWRE